MYEYMVSYQLLSGDCGNKCGTLAEVNDYANNNKTNWKSHTFFRFTPGQAITELAPVDAATGNPTEIYSIK
jgi:hypothetical protein